MPIKSLLPVFIIIASIISFTCSEGNQPQKRLFGKLKDGSEVYLYTLKNYEGMRAEITNYGATVVSLFVADNNKKFEDVILGYDSLKGYINGRSYFGAIVGRYGNRIGKGQFTLDGKEYQLTINNGRNHLHGGTIGFNKKLWKTDFFDGRSLRMTLVSPDGDQGYPGKVTLTVTYTITDDDGLKIDYEATTDKPTIINPTNHCYFNLSGDPGMKILNHELMIDADNYTPIDNEFITTGEIANVKGAPMDFRKPTAIGLRINDNFQQLKYGKGYDHNWVLNNYNGKVREVASVYEPSSGRFMVVFTDQPGVQFYSGNFLDGTETGKGGVHYKHRTGMCLETQHFPDSPNKKNFPSVELKPGETFTSTTIYKFSTK